MISLVLPRTFFNNDFSVKMTYKYMLHKYKRTLVRQNLLRNKIDDMFIKVVPSLKGIVFNERDMKI